MKQLTEAQFAQITSDCSEAIDCARDLLLRFDPVRIDQIKAAILDSLAGSTAVDESRLLDAMASVGFLVVYKSIAAEQLT